MRRAFHWAVQVLRWAAGLLACLGFLAVFALPILCSSPWSEAGYVRIEPGSEHVELTGVPGDRIKLRLPLPADVDADYGETSALIVDPETGLETVTRLDVKVDDDEEPDRVFAWLIVPEVPPRTIRTLNGSLSGYATTSKGTLGRFEVPFTLRVGPRGSIATSGAKDMTWQNRVKVTLVLLVFALVLQVLAALAALVVVALRANQRNAEFLRQLLGDLGLEGEERAAADPGRSPERRPSTSSAPQAQEGV